LDKFDKEESEKSVIFFSVFLLFEKKSVPLQIVLIDNKQQENNQ
jgi:hypothetical protein